MTHRRRRLIFLGYLKDSKIYKELAKDTHENWILKTGVLAKGFKNSFEGEANSFSFDGDLVNVSNTFNKGGGKSLFKNSGVMINGEIYTCRTKAVYKGKKRVTLGDILENGKVDEEFYIDKSSLPKWDYLKGSKKEKRVTSSGFEYNYAEGAMIFPDDLNKPSRTIITSEGGASPSRFRHVVKTQYGLRRLTPIELERLNMFPRTLQIRRRIKQQERLFNGKCISRRYCLKIAKVLAFKLKTKNKKILKKAD